MGIGQARDSPYHPGRSGDELMPPTDALDLVAVHRFFAEHEISVQGALRASQIAGGRSNLTYKVSDDSCTAWVLRRPPNAGVTPTAHDVGREYRIMDALQGNGFPVARTVVQCTDVGVIGAPFSIVEFVAGDVLRTQADLVGLTDQQVAATHAELIGVLARLHSFSYDDLGLADFGRPDGFVDRQIRRWRRQWDHVATRELDDVDRLYRALVDSPPIQRHSSIVHGDFRVDNTLLDVDRSRILALVDWEMATLGDPLTDLATMCAYQHPSFDYVVGEPAASTSVRWPGADATVQAYTLAAGVDVVGFNRYLALALFKLAVIAEGIAARYRSGVGDGPGFATSNEAVPGLIASGLSAMGSC